MGKYLGKTWDEWNQLGAENTVLSILSQPKAWEDTLNAIEEQKHISKFVQDFIHHNPNGRIILTGTISSAYACDIAVPFLHYRKDYRFVSIPSTDIVPSPGHYLDSKIPTLFVTLSRSGNTPEQIGAYNLVKTEVKNYKHLLITCHQESELAELSKKDPNSETLFLPELANDRSFSMLSSFTSSLLALLMVFENDPKTRSEDFRKVAKHAEKVIQKLWPSIFDLAQEDFKKVIFVGTDAFQGLTKEAAHKCIEFTAGNVDAYFESTLGFRYRKLFALDSKTLIFQLMANAPYIRQYEEDLLHEIHANTINPKIASLFWDNGEKSKTDVNYQFEVGENISYLGSGYATIIYSLVIQIFSLFLSAKYGIRPDDSEFFDKSLSASNMSKIYPYDPYKIEVRDIKKARD